MKLETYLRQNGVSHAAFAEQIGTSQAAVSRYASGARIPRPVQMARIKAATGGAVCANDFMPAETEGEAA